LRVRFLADANLDHDIVAGVLRRAPEIDFESAIEVPSLAFFVPSIFVACLDLVPLCVPSRYLQFGFALQDFGFGTLYQAMLLEPIVPKLNVKCGASPRTVADVGLPSSCAQGRTLRKVAFLAYKCSEFAALFYRNFGRTT
jgi:hypothetical protein